MEFGAVVSSKLCLLKLNGQTDRQTDRQAARKTHR